MRKDKILDHDLMPLERIMVWTNRTSLFHVKQVGTIGYWLVARRNKVSVGQAGQSSAARAAFHWPQDSGAGLHRPAPQTLRQSAASVAAVS
jgi:hypothetical protein